MTLSCDVLRGIVVIFITPAFASSQCAQVDGQISEHRSDSGQCETFTQGSTQLRWRAAPYPGVRGGSVYGGQYAVDAFAKNRFDGPVIGDDWDVLFTHHPHAVVLDAARLPSRSGRLVNHCMYFKAAGQKCQLARHIERVQQALARNASTEVARKYLLTFDLHNPDKYEEWFRTLKAEPDQYWLIKPCAAGKSEGIRLLNGHQVKLAEEAEGTWAVAQEYLDRPFLGFGGRKFHLRLYVHVTRWSPIGAFLYDGGLVFRSRYAYKEKQPSVARDIFSSVSNDVEPLELSVLWDAIGTDATSAARAHIVGLLVEIMGNALQDSFGEAGRLDVRGFACFDLFGMDVIMDDRLQPFILEINQGPNLWTKEDSFGYEELLRAVKGPLIDQMVHWMTLRTRRPPRTAQEAEQIEDASLISFTRIL